MLSPYDAHAVEEALQLKSKFSGSTVTVLSAGPERIRETLIAALAMGADRAVRVDLPETADNAMTAKALMGALKIQDKEKVDVIFTGKEAIDDGAAQVSQLLAAGLGIPAITVVLKVEYTEKSVKCKREVEGGTFEMVESTIPVVIAAQKGINEPRYASLPNIMRAKKKEIPVLSLSDVGISEADQKIKMKNFKLPPAKEPGKKLEGTPEEQAKALVKALHEEAKVI